MDEILKNFEKGIRDGIESAKANHVDGGPAFPRSTNEYNNGSEGMTLWDYFAAKALSGLSVPINGDLAWSIDGVTEVASKIADAMLAERKKRFGGSNA